MKVTGGSPGKRAWDTKRKTGRGGKKNWFKCKTWKKGKVTEGDATETRTEALGGKKKKRRRTAKVVYDQKGKGP